MTDKNILEISCEDLNKKLKQEETCLLIDVRDTKELELASIKGVRHIPLEDLAAAASDLPQNLDIILICHHGIRSLQGCCWLRQYGLKRIMSLRGGLHEWSQKIDPSIPLY